MGAIDGIDRKARGCIQGVRDIVSGIGVPPYAVFRSEKFHQIDVGSAEQDVDSGSQVAVHAAGIGNQSDLLSNETFEAPAFQHFDSGPDTNCVPGREPTGKEAQRKQSEYDFFQYVHLIKSIFNLSCRIQGRSCDRQ